MTEQPPAAAPGRAGSGRAGLVKSPSDLLGGASLVVLASLALWSARGLDLGTLRSMGPGMLPRAIALGIGAAGLAIAAAAFVRPGAPLGRWPLRGPIAVTLAVVAFALTIRTVGLAVAGPLVMIVGGAGSPDSRPRELVVYALVMTALAIGLFRYLLSLPIPVLIIPGVLIL